MGMDDKATVVVNLSDVSIDFPAWAEDRRELRYLRDKLEQQREKEERIARRLQVDAARIHDACDWLDDASGELRGIGRKKR